MAPSKSALAKLLIVAGLACCSCAKSVDASAQPTPKPMPPNAQWQGIYQGPYHIALNIQTRGNQASGTWRAIGDREGEFTGTVSGNLLVIDWTERALRNGESTTGRGYFVYDAGKIRGAHEIYGQWGMGQPSGGSPWWAIKRADRPLDALSARLIDKDNPDDDRNEDDTQSCEPNCDVVDSEQQ